MASAGSTRAILILVENLSVPFDRRVWQESLALRDAGYRVFVVCPRGTKRDTEPYEERDGITIMRYGLRPATGGPLEYLREYSVALAKSAWLTRRVASRVRIDAVHACNPPDLFFLLALPMKLAGARFVFDHHDLVPELFRSRFGGRGALYYATLALELMTFRAADMVITTNDSYRRVAIQRGRVDPDNVRVVRSAPDLSRFVERPPSPALRRGASHLLVYLGVMGPQDGVDLAISAIAELSRRRSDFRAVFIGEGDVYPEMRALSQRLGLDGVIEFTGRIPDAEVIDYLSTADVCLAPDPKNPLNDVSTMNKIVEYMAMSRPLVSFDLVEARVSAGEAAEYARANEVGDFADAISRLLDDPERRAEMGRIGRRRVEESLSWDRSRVALVDAYRDLFADAP